MNKKIYILIPTAILIAFVFAILFFSLLGYDAVKANGKVPDSTQFGMGLEKTNTSGTVGVISDDSFGGNALDSKEAQNQITDFSSRNINNIVTDINKVLEQRAREEAERKKRLKDEHYAKVAERIDKFKEKYGMPEGLQDIDWYVDEDVFVSTWAEKIDAYLKGSPMEGKGKVFAKAAWDNCIDPRWSPAISNTESSKGVHCFKPYNAWGWGDSSWENWDDAINTHVKELSDKYDYTIAKPLAEKYCPPNHEHWYDSTLEQMNKITEGVS